MLSPNNWFNWHFSQWFSKFPRYDTIGWLAIIFVGAYWEVMGAIYKDRTTFTDLVRHTTPIWLRLVILNGVLFWHFCISKANYPNGGNFISYLLTPFKRGL